MVQFTLPRATSYTLEVMNTDGQVVYAIRAQGQKGSNQVVIRKEDLRQNGVYMIQLTSDDQTVSKKMILTE